MRTAARHRDAFDGAIGEVFVPPPLTTGRETLLGLQRCSDLGEDVFIRRATQRTVTGADVR